MAAAFRLKTSGFYGWSSQWDGFFISLHGELALYFHGVEVNYVSLRGRAQTQRYIAQSQTRVKICRLVTGDVEACGLAMTIRRPSAGGSSPSAGLFDGIKMNIQRKDAHLRCRSFCLYTHEGAIGSNPVRAETLSVVVTGLGAAFWFAPLTVQQTGRDLFGGEWEDPIAGQI
jgi:hypothetical protein